ncbi:MAG: hypothetical protein Q9225_000964 [Loekoesia sp. 1 TL-2023]
MGWDYALVYEIQVFMLTSTSANAPDSHLYYNIPPAVLLTVCYYPLCTKLDVYKIAVVSTTPWDSYLIRRRIWTYPPDAIVGPTLFSIPAEEIFFFVIQTYNTSLLYLFASKPTFHPVYLSGELPGGRGRRLKKWKWLGILLLVAAILTGAGLIVRGGQGLYLGRSHISSSSHYPSRTRLYRFPYPRSIFGSLIQLRCEEELGSLNQEQSLGGISGTAWTSSKLFYGRSLLHQLIHAREAFFFLITNTLIVFGLVAFDNALAILHAFPTLFPTVPALPSPVQLVKALLVSPTQYDDERILGLEEALRRLRRKSRSFYLASGCFQGRLRIDLVLLYSFCRVADDLVDNATSVSEARHWISKLTEFLDICYTDGTAKSETPDDFIRRTFPPKEQTALLQLPTTYLPPTPLYDLIKGFGTDLEFSSNTDFPILDEQTLQVYASRVAGTVAELCLELVFHHTNLPTIEDQRRKIVQAGGRMGIALQYVNISRDIAVDARIKRVYLPTEWLKFCNLRPLDVIQDPTSAGVEALRQRLLDKAMAIYNEAKGAIELLPSDSRAAMRVAVESYVEIGRVLQESRYKLKAGRATVPKLRRLKVAWTALRKG